MATAFKCPKCGTTTWGNLKYCPNCGEPFTITCPECGYRWRYMYEYKFCPSCGVKMTRPSYATAPKEESHKKKTVKKIKI